MQKPNRTLLPKSPFSKEELKTSVPNLYLVERIYSGGWEESLRGRRGQLMKKSPVLPAQ